jgi:hypothetical protein
MRSFSFVLAMLFAIVVFAIVSQLCFLFVTDEETLASLLDMRLHTWLNSER